MVGSIDSLEIFPDLTFSEETNAIPIDCWQNICLSKIWIPSHLLPSRKNPSNSRVTQGIYHTLQKRDHTNFKESFSVYSDYDDENEEEEVFLSDSNEDGLDIYNLSCEEIQSCSKGTSENISTVTTNNALVSKEHSSNNERFSKTGSLWQKYKNEHEKVNNFCKLKSLPSLNNLSSILAEECTESAGSFGKLMNNRLNEYKGNNIVSANHQKKENTPQNALEFFVNSSEVGSKSKETDKIINTDKVQTMKKDDESVASHISLQEILDTTAETNMCDFMRDFTIKNENNCLSKKEKVVESSKKQNNKKDKKKKKPVKSVTLDQFLEDYDEEDKQEDYCNDYLRKLLINKNNDGTAQIRSTVEFPNLAPEELRFIHSEKSELKISHPTTQTFSEILTKSDEVNQNNQNENIYREKISTSPEITSSLGKIVIENIPGEVCHEDIYSILCGYGEIKDFSLEPDGNFLKASVEIDLICDIDWIIDCLNGTEPFGASSKVLKCYKQL